MRDDQHNHGVMEAGGYDRIISTIVPHQQELIRVALAYLPTDSAGILELGCGTGILTEKLLDACPGAAVTGLDISDEMLDIARNKPGLCGASFITRDIRRAWPGRGYDAIVSSLCLHHLSPREREKVIHRAARALRPSGRFICGDIFRAEHDWEERLLTGAWERAMRDAGAGEDVISGMLAQRARHLTKLSTIPRFREQCAQAGFSRVFVPFSAGFVGLVVGFTGGLENPPGNPARSRLTDKVSGVIGEYGSSCISRFAAGSAEFLHRPRSGLCRDLPERRVSIVRCSQKSPPFSTG